VGGVEVEGEALVDVENEAAADFEVVEEATLAADEDAILFVDPDGAGDVADDAFGLVVGFGVGIAGVVEDDGGAVVEEDAAGVGEGAQLEDAGDGDEVVAAGVGFFALAGALLATFASFGYLLVDAVTFLLSFFGGEGFAVLSNDAVDATSSMVTLSESVVMVFLRCPLRSSCWSSR
jgi:hypothetical protein